MQMGILDKISEFIGGRNTLYFSGCMERYVFPNISENYKKILNICGVEFIQIDELCCGSPAISAGYTEDAKILAAKNYGRFKDHGVGKVITSCPACYSTLKTYEKLLPEMKIKTKIEHSTVTIADAIKRGKLKLNKIGKNEKVTIHDPCHLKHYGLFNETREILTAIGYNVIEMPHNKENAICCGGGGGLRANFPAISTEIAKSRAKEASNIANFIVTTCPLCYAQLREHCACKELSEVLINAI